MVEKTWSVKMNKTEFCCKLMNQFLDDPKVPLQYYPIAREYGMILNQSPAVQLIFYCPWCGCKLPESVREFFFEILEKEYNVDPEWDIKNDPNVPDEFKSDEWWKKRGL